MCRSGGEPARSLALRAAFWVGLAIAGAGLAGPAAAQAPPAAAEQDLSPAVRQNLKQIQDLWLQLAGAFQRSEADRAVAFVEELEGQAGALGFAALPDLALGAWAVALRAAEAGRPGEAELALAAGERLDPGRPEGAFAAVKVAAVEGRWGGVAAGWLRALARLGAQPAERWLALRNVGFYALWVVVVTGLALVALAAAAYGPALAADLSTLLGRRLAGALVPVAVVVLLVWPLALPPWPPWPPGSPIAALWLALWWSVLLWPYLGGGLRACVATVWIGLALAPFAIAEHRLRVAVTLSPPVRALDAVVAQRLYGGLFADLAMLRSQLPNHPAVLQLLGDLHRRMGDWDSARVYYRDVLAAEPDNVAALLDLGAFHFFRRDYASAAESFKAASAIGGGSAAAYFNLGQTLRYQFQSGEEMSNRARALDGPQVQRWVDDQTRVVVVDRGIERAGEIRAALLAARREAAGGGRGGVATALALFLLALAAGAAVLLRRGLGPAASLDEPEVPSRRSLGGRALRVLVPGWRSVCEDRGAGAFGALLPVVALLGLPLSHRFADPLPLGMIAGDAGSWPVVAVGLAAVFAGRLAVVARSTR